MSWFMNLRKFQQTLGTYQKDPQPAVYEGNPSICVFWGTWGMKEINKNDPHIPG